MLVRCLYFSSLLRRSFLSARSVFVSCLFYRSSLGLTLRRTPDHRIAKVFVVCTRSLRIWQEIHRILKIGDGFMADVDVEDCAEFDRWNFSEAVH
jgi:hypothetical protein